MKTFLSSLLLIVSASLVAQVKLPQRQIKIIAGSSTHSTGDNSGVAFATEFEKYFSKRLSWTVALGGTIHDGFFPIFFDDPPGHPIDGSYRYTTAGIQLSGHLGYHFVRTARHEFQGRLGALVRYQSSSYFDQFVVLYPPATGLSIPVNYFVNTTPQRTYAVGGSCQLLYDYTFKNNLSIGALAGFQADTNGDNISQLSLSVGKRF